MMPEQERFVAQVRATRDWEIRINGHAVSTWRRETIDALLAIIDAQAKDAAAVKDDTPVTGG